MGHKAEVEKTQNARLVLQPALVMVKVEAVDTGLRLQARIFETALHGTAMACFQLHIDEPLQRGRDGEILTGRFRQGLLQLAAYGRQLELFEFLFQGSHGNPFRAQEGKHRRSAARVGR